MGGLDGFRFKNWSDYKTACDVLMALNVENIISEQEYEKVHRRLERFCVDHGIVRDNSNEEWG